MSKDIQEPWTVRSRWASAAAVIAASVVATLLTPAAPAAAATGLVFNLTNSNASSSPSYSFGYGTTDMTPVVGDWDGNGTATVGVVQVSGSGQRWSLTNSNASSGASYDFGWGAASCKPVTGDWNGDGKTTPGNVCRDTSTSPASWSWRLHDFNSAGGVEANFRFGNASCQPVTGDWNGDRRDTIGVSCDSGSGRTWSLRNSNSAGGADISYGWGNAGCVALPGDWDGNGTTTGGQACEAENSNGIGWMFAQTNSNASSGAVKFGYGNASTTDPIVGDWNGDGRTTVGVVTAKPATAPSGTVAPNPYGASTVSYGWTPRMQYVVDKFKAAHPAVTPCGGQANGSASGHIPGSDHYTGNGADCLGSARYGTTPTAAEKAEGDAGTNWLVANAGNLKVKYVIWYGRIWTPSRGWHAYCHSNASTCGNPNRDITLNHYDHVHISVVT